MSIITHHGIEHKLPLPIGTKTKWGKIEAIGWTGGERYYWMIGANGVAMMPAFIVEGVK